MLLKFHVAAFFFPLFFFFFFFFFNVLFFVCALNFQRKSMPYLSRKCGTYAHGLALVKVLLARPHRPLVMNW